MEFSLEGFLSTIKTRFERLDTDGDGLLSKAEFLFLSQYPRTKQPDPGEDESKDDGDSERDGLPGYIGMPLDIAKLEFPILDQNKDDQISWTEMKAPVEAAASMDVNDDGKIDRSELASFRDRKTNQGKAQDGSK